MYTFNNLLCAQNSSRPQVDDDNGDQDNVDMFPGTCSLTDTRTPTSALVGQDARHLGQARPGSWLPRSRGHRLHGEREMLNLDITLHDTQYNEMNRYKPARECPPA